ncbi:MAG: hypothetical protein U1C97_00370 [Candidatus Gracilibacteria bacterium]|nr:hypothetical protein [bacterium]MDZ4216755.1 hypothetical protein [Candidatus Gracilibacteria bacterium]
MSDKGDSIPVIINKRIEDTGPIHFNVRDSKIERAVTREEHVSLDKIIEDSQSSFLITGKSTKIQLMNFLNLIDRHELADVMEDMRREEIVISSNLITQIATAPVVDEDDEDMKYIDSFAIGIFCSALFLSIFALITKTVEDLRTFAWILLLISLFFLGNYTYRGIKSGQLKKVIRVCIKSLSKK